MEHDQLFKELITTFFREFIQLFFPNLAEFLDSEFSLIPMSQEIFGDAKRHIVDLLMRGKFKGQEAYFLIHVENQAKAESDFSLRMYGYFSRLHLKYKLPVYPIVLFSYDTPKRAEPRQYVVTFPDTQVLRFQYRVVQLNRIPWRRFLKSNNPVATALMTKMKIAVKDRPKARLELLRMLASHKLDPVKTRLLGLFIDRYLALTEAEMKKFERELAGIVPAERVDVVEIVSSWELKGMEKIIMRQIRKRFGIVTEEMAARIDRLSAEQLNELGEALFDFTSLADLEQWLARQ